MSVPVMAASQGGMRDRSAPGEAAAVSQAVRVFKRCLKTGDVPPVWVSEGGLEHSSRGFFPRVVKSPAACSSAVKTGEMSPASVPERGLDPVFR